MGPIVWESSVDMTGNEVRERRKHFDLLQAILKDRDDDSPRFAYAAWLEKRNVPRAEFIRIQCQTATTGWLPSQHTLRHREAKLLEEHAETWLNETPELLPFFPEFGRGFVEELTVRATTLVEHPNLLDVAPIRSLVLTSGTDETLDRITTLPQLGHIRNLFLPHASEASEVGLRHLASLRRLTTLKLTDLSIGDKGGECLAKLTHLQRLMISFATISPNGRRMLQANFGDRLELRGCT